METEEPSLFVCDNRGKREIIKQVHEHGIHLTVVFPQAFNSEIEKFCQISCLFWGGGKEGSKKCFCVFLYFWKFLCVSVFLMHISIQTS